MVASGDRDDNNYDDYDDDFDDDYGCCVAGVPAEDDDDCDGSNVIIG